MSDGARAHVRYESHAGAGSITIDRPKVNAYEIGLMEGLLGCVEAADGDRDVRAVVLRSGVPGVFSVGADIRAWLANDDAGNQRLVDAARRTAAAIESSDKLFIAAIGGHALGGGLELAMACDLRYVAGGDYQLGLPEVRLGLMPGNGGTQRLSRLVGSGRALEMAATGESIGPSRALAIGLVDRLLEPDALDEEADAFARSLSVGAGMAIAAIKRSIHDGASLPLADALTVEAREADALYATPDAIEGFRAYAEKRSPVFGGGGGSADR